MGRGSSKLGGGGQTGSGLASVADRNANLSANQQKAIVDKTGFVSDGFGGWNLDIPGIGGAQILDETDGTLGGYGRVKIYSIRVWNADNDFIAGQNYSITAATLNAAKESAKRYLKQDIDGRS